MTTVKDPASLNSYH